MDKKTRIYTILIIIFSIICGILSKDYYIGSIILMTALLNSYYASEGKIINYLFGAIYSLFVSYVSYKNGLYGLATLCILVYIPSQILGYFSWKNKINKNNEVNVKGFTLKLSLLITSICVIGGLLFGYLLSLIPTQELPFLDSSSNIINLSAVVLMALRYKECWMIWLFNNTIDLVIWIINVLRGNPYSIMMLISSIGFLLINIYGLYKWILMEKKNKKKI